MKIRNKRTGEIIEIPDQPGARPVGPVDPKIAPQLQGLTLGNQRTAQQIDSDRQLLPLQVQKARADAVRAQAEARQSSGLDPQKLANIRAAQGQLDRLQYLFDKGPGRTDGLRGLLDYLPSPENKQFDTAGAGLGEVGLAAFRVPGVGSQSDAELRAFIAANRPSSSDYDSVIKEKLGNLQNRLNQTYQTYKVKRPDRQKYKDSPKTVNFNDLPE